ncbi:MAG: SusC/RagA family TonB-linked outer membrane protein [Bacteroidia bacterium]
MIFKRKLLILVVMLSSISYAFAQRQIEGTIVDAKTREPLIGANIYLLNSEKGTSTDANGTFRLEADNEDNLIKFSYTGYESKTVLMGDLTYFKITLKSGKMLEEVVVVGYGTQSKVKVTSAISTIDEVTLKKIPVPQVSNALEGLAPGLFVRQGSGEPGFSGSSFEVRNFGNALVIVDGSPGNLDELDPNEIENITVLKDAAAASVYGVQGGNGVILVTTRKGKVGKPVLNYSTNTTFTAFTTYPDFLNSQQYATILNEGRLNDGMDSFFNQSQIDAYTNGTDPINYPNENWKEKLFKDWGRQQRHNLNLTGGNDKVRYFVSAGYLKQGSNYTVDVLNYEQYNVRSNIDADITDNLSLKLNFAGRRRINEAPAYSAYDIFRELFRAMPIDLAYYPDGTPARPSFSPNHILEGISDFNAGYYRARNNNLDAKLTLEWDVPFIEGLKTRTYGSLVYNHNYQKEWGKSYELYTLNRATGEYDVFVAAPEGSFSETVLTHRMSYGNNYVFQQALNYDRKFNGVHTVKGLVLGEVLKSQGEDFWGRRQDFQSTLIDQLYAGSLENQNASGGEYRENRLGLVGRVNYDYDARYFIESSFRYDGSSRFKPGNQWGFFPSVSAGWRLSENAFFQGLKPIFSDAKIRASYGTAGSDGTAAYQWLSGFTFNHFFIPGQDVVPTIDNTSLANEDLTWETISTYNAGLDLKFYNNKLSVSFDYFFRDRDGVLANPSASIPSTLGVGVAAQNLHSYSNEGYEVGVGYNKNLGRDIKFNAQLNFSRSREKAVFIDEAIIEDEFMRENLTITGGYTNLRRGYVSDGLFQTDEEIANHATQDNSGNSTLQPGDIRYTDLNDDGIIDVRDQQVFGNGNKPAYNYSLNLSMDYKRLSVGVLLTGAFGYDIYLGGEAQAALRNNFNGYTYQMDYWTEENTDARFPRVSDGGFNENNYRYSDFWMRDGTHLRIRNVNVSYSAPEKMSQFLGFSDLRFTFTGFNLHVFKTYTEEFDPQMQTDLGWYYPQLKSYSLGLNITL